jgi:hypothetical protein
MAGTTEKEPFKMAEILLSSQPHSLDSIQAIYGINPSLVKDIGG